MEDVDPNDILTERKLGEVDKSFYLIGVGASAGGLDALKQLISQIPANFPHSFVVVQHISPDYKSLMSEILGRETALPVLEVADNMTVEPGHIYLIPPRANIVIQGTKEDSNVTPTDEGELGFSGLRFSLVDPTPRPAMNLPIDVFFYSLSEAVRDRAVAIVLSGTGSDGSRGIRAVKDREGFVLVQDPTTAAFDGMPRASISSGIVDLILPPDGMVGEMLRYFEMRESGILSVDSVFSHSDEELSEILALVSQRSEIDFSLYKKPTLKRRIARRMALAGHETLSEYLAQIRSDKLELNLLYREFLVGVTNFFRDLPVWNTLVETVLPDLFSEGDLEEPVRVWSVGCSTGEEAFTVAMLLEQFRSKAGIQRDFRIYATDVNETAIQAAREGIYPDSVREEIPNAFFDSNFLMYRSGTISIAASIRKKVIFSPHNVIEDPPYTRMDFIICRNLLIYLSPDVQAKVMTQFSFSLRRGGILLLGAAETPGQHGVTFQAIVNKARIFQNTRRIDASRSRSHENFSFPAANFLPRSRRMSEKRRRPESDITELFINHLTASQMVVFLVEANGQLVRSFGKHEDILQVPDSSLIPNLLELVDDRLRSTLALMLRTAEMHGTATKKNVRLAATGELKAYDVSCTRVAWESYTDVFALTLQIRDTIDHQNLVEASKDDTGSTAAQKAYIEHLESEIESLQDMLTATAEDLGTSNEELQTTNEELIASNEELQSNNEETQSINEELHTVNAENIEKIAELEAATADINNLLAIAEVGILVLGEDLRIRRFSEGIQTYVNLDYGDIGLPIEKFSFTLEPDSVARLTDDLQLSISTGEDCDRELRRRDGGWVLSFVRPYRDVLGEPQGVVVSLLDITETKILQDEVRNQRDRLEAMLESEAAGYWDRDIPGKVEFMSPSFKAMLGYKDDEVANTLEARESLIHPEDLPLFEQQFEAHVASKGSVPYDNEIRYFHKDGTAVWVLCRGRVVEWDDDGQPLRMMGVHIDITHLREREEAVREDEVRRRAEEVKRFAFIAAHDLLQPVITIESAVAMLLNRLPKIEEDSDLNKVAAYLESATDRLRARIKGVLAYSRLQEDQLELEKIDLHEIAETCVKDLEASISDAKAEIEIEKLPVASGSRSLIEQVVQNLLSNALKYRRPDDACRINITEETAPNGMVAIRVADNGIGIDPKHRKKVFELFGRLHTEEEFPGEGIGLAVCERIVSLHGGDIQVSDGMDGGTAFVVTLKSGH